MPISDLFSQLKSGTKAPSERIRNKIKLLLELKKQGIWLVDASIIALYNKGIKPSNDVFNEVIKTSWNHYTKNLIADAKPNHVIIVGKGAALAVLSLGLLVAARQMRRQVRLPPHRLRGRRRRARRECFQFGPFGYPSCEGSSAACQKVVELKHAAARPSTVRMSAASCTPLGWKTSLRGP